MENRELIPIDEEKQLYNYNEQADDLEQEEPHQENDKRIFVFD